MIAVIAHRFYHVSGTALKNAFFDNFLYQNCCLAVCFSIWFLLKNRTRLCNEFDHMQLILFHHISFSAGLEEMMDINRLLPITDLNALLYS